MERVDWSAQAERCWSAPTTSSELAERQLQPAQAPQHRVRAVHGAVVHQRELGEPRDQRLERDLGRKLDDVFASIDAEALAAASLAQVHRAILRDGTQVVLKIQYPEIRRIIPLDLQMLRRVVGLIQPLQGLIDLRTLVNEVTRFIELELDFEREVGATERLRGILAECPHVRIPRVHRELCGPNVIVLEYLDGIRITRTDELVAAGHKLPSFSGSACRMG